MPLHGSLDTSWTPLNFHPMDNIAIGAKLWVFWPNLAINSIISHLYMILTANPVKFKFFPDPYCYTLFFFW